MKSWSSDLPLIKRNPVIRANDGISFYVYQMLFLIGIYSALEEVYEVLD